VAPLERHVRSALNIRPSPQNFEGPFCATIADIPSGRLTHFSQDN
jgi:hypothetical protein